MAMWPLLNLHIFLQMYRKLILIHRLNHWFVDQISLTKQYNPQHCTPVAFDFPIFAANEMQRKQKEKKNNTEFIE